MKKNPASVVVESGNILSKQNVLQHSSVMWHFFVGKGLALKSLCHHENINVVCSEYRAIESITRITTRAAFCISTTVFRQNISARKCTYQLKLSSNVPSSLNANSSPRDTVISNEKLYLCSRDTGIKKKNNEELIQTNMCWMLHSLMQQRQKNSPLLFLA